VFYSHVDTSLTEKSLGLSDIIAGKLGLRRPLRRKHEHIVLRTARQDKQGKNPCQKEVPCLIHACKVNENIIKKQKIIAFFLFSASNKKNGIAMMDDTVFYNNLG
jgi:hypothetical protein